MNRKTPAPFDLSPKISTFNTVVIILSLYAISVVGEFLTTTWENERLRSQIIRSNLYTGNFYS